MTLSPALRTTAAYLIMSAILVIVGFVYSWSFSLTVLSLCTISAVTALGVNLQWGYAGLFNAGVMGFSALGGLAAVLVSQPPVAEAWSVGGTGMLLALIIVLAMVAALYFAHTRIHLARGKWLLMGAIFVAFYWLLMSVAGPAIKAIEGVNPAETGYLGGLGLPVLLSWPVGGLLAAGAAILIGKVALGLRADYLAIATLGISEIVIFIIKNEDWLARGVKNVTGLSRDPVPYELSLIGSDWFRGWIAWIYEGRLAGLSGEARADLLQQLTVGASGIFVKLCFCALFAVVLVIVLILLELALKSPWGRMVRAIRDNEVAASAMGKNITARHLQIFVIGSAIVGIAGAMLVTLDGQFTPGTYNPLRFTFLILVMVIVGGQGNNFGAVLGGFFIWTFWILAEPLGGVAMDYLTWPLGDGSALRTHLLDAAPHMRLFLMGIILLTVLRFSPKGLLPETVSRSR